MLIRHAQAAAAREGGFTMIELLAAMAIMAVLVAAFSQLLSLTIIRGGRTQEQSTLQTQVRAAVDVLASDLRQAMCNDTTLPVTTATSTQVTFYTPDRATPYHLQQVSYRLSSGNFQRAFATSTNTGGPPWTIPALGPWQTEVGSVVNASIFTYRDAAGAVTTVPGSVARVDTVLKLTPKATATTDSTTTYTSTVDLRIPTCAT